MGFFSSIIQDSRLTVAAGSSAPAEAVVPPPLVEGDASHTLAPQYSEPNDTATQVSKRGPAPAMQRPVSTTHFVADDEPLAEQSAAHPSSLSQASNTDTALPAAEVSNVALGHEVQAPHASDSPLEHPGERNDFARFSITAELGPVPGQVSAEDAPQSAPYEYVQSEPNAKQIQTPGPESFDVSSSRDAQDAVDGQSHAPVLGKPIADSADAQVPASMDAGVDRYDQDAQKPAPQVQPTKQAAPPALPEAPAQTPSIAPELPAGLQQPQALQPQVQQVRIGQVTVVVEGPIATPARTRPGTPEGPGGHQLLRGL